jgi:molybdopterin synthase catalytic subunit
VIFEIVSEAILIESIAASVASPEAGAVATFCGTTRQTNRGRKVLRLEYEAYEDMAVADFQRIGREMAERWNLIEVTIVHRVGVVAVGETSIGIAVSAPHRGDAFAACRYAIDSLKHSAPIWKKEHFEGGEVWIGSLADCEHED